MGLLWNVVERNKVSCLFEFDDFDTAHTTHENYAYTFPQWFEIGNILLILRHTGSNVTQTRLGYGRFQRFLNKKAFDDNENFSVKCTDMFMVV